MKLLSRKVSGLCNLVDNPVSVQTHKNVFFCCNEHKCIQVLLGDSAPKSVLHKLRGRKTSLTGHLNSG